MLVPRDDQTATGPAGISHVYTETRSSVFISTSGTTLLSAPTLAAGIYTDSAAAGLEAFGTTECTLSLGGATDTEQLDSGFNMLYLTVSATLANPASPTLSCQQETTSGAVAETAHETIELVGALN